jgi:hypothetical protein
VGGAHSKEDPAGEPGGQSGSAKQCHGVVSC